MAFPVVLEGSTIKLALLSLPERVVNQSLYSSESRHLVSSSRPYVTTLWPVSPRRDSDRKPLDTPPARV